MYGAEGAGKKFDGIFPTPIYKQTPFISNSWARTSIPFINKGWLINFWGLLHNGNLRFYRFVPILFSQLNVTIPCRLSNLHVSIPEVQSSFIKGWRGSQRAPPRLQALLVWSKPFLTGNWKTKRSFLNSESQSNMHLDRWETYTC